MFFKKWPPLAILDIQKSLLTISDQYHNFYFCEFVYKMAAGGHFGYPKLTFDRISGHFRSIRNFFFFLEIFDKMAAVGHFGCTKFTFDVLGVFVMFKNLAAIPSIVGYRKMSLLGRTRSHDVVQRHTSQCKLKTSHDVPQCCAMIVRHHVMVGR